MLVSQIIKMLITFRNHIKTSNFFYVEYIIYLIVFILFPGFSVEFNLISVH